MNNKGIWGDGGVYALARISNTVQRGVIVASCKTALITGGVGFIGANLCRRLLRDGWQVVCLDNLVSGREENIADLAESTSFSFMYADVADPSVFDSIDSVDRIYNLACPASPPFYQVDPIATMKTSVFGAINVLELARRTGARVLQTSTSEIYGDPLEHPQREDYRGNVNPIGLRACYDEGKRAAETLFFDYRRQYGVDVRVVRIFNTYGPGMRPDDGRVMTNFVSQALRGENITVYGDGTQTRSFCYVDDMVDALVAMMECEGFIGPVNLGNPEELTMLELAQRVIALTGSSSQLEYCDLPSDDPVRRKPDISLAKEMLGWQLRVRVDEGIAQTIKYFRGLAR